MKRRVVAVFTGNRAEYGLQYPILKAIDAHPGLEYRLIVSGAHLDEDFGRTLAEIKRDGFEIFSEATCDMGEDTLAATAHAIGGVIQSVGNILNRLRPDILVVYADRFEGFAALTAGTQMGIPTAHIEGGDITEGGALDDSVRHAMTKLAHLHFTTNDEAAWRIRQMGEEPWRVHNVGFPAIDLIAAGNFASPEDLSGRYGLDLKRSLLLFTQHSVATQFEEAAVQVRPSIEALERLARTGYQVVLTYPNNDAGGRRIIAELDAMARHRLPGVQLHKSLGRFDYHGMLNIIGRISGGACLGNSSSGIKETPAFACPTANIGSRQAGRLAGRNVIDVGYEADAIYAAALRCVDDDRFLSTCRTAHNPYGKGNAGKKIAEILAKTPLDRCLIVKKMTIKTALRRDGAA